MFPAVKYEAVLQQVETCEGSLNALQEQVRTKVDQNHFKVVGVSPVQFSSTSDLMEYIGAFQEPCYILYILTVV